MSKRYIDFYTIKPGEYAGALEAAFAPGQSAGKTIFQLASNAGYQALGEAERLEDLSFSPPDISMALMDLSVRGHLMNTLQDDAYAVRPEVDREGNMGALTMVAANPVKLGGALPKLLQLFPAYIEKGLHLYSAPISESYIKDTVSIMFATDSGSVFKLNAHGGDHPSMGIQIQDCDGTQNIHADYPSEIIALAVWLTAQGYASLAARYLSLGEHSIGLSTAYQTALELLGDTLTQMKNLPVTVDIHSSIVNGHLIPELSRVDVYASGNPWGRRREGSDTDSRKEDVLKLYNVVKAREGVTTKPSTSPLRSDSVTDNLVMVVNGKTYEARNVCDGGILSFFKQRPASSDDCGYGEMAF